MGIGKWSPTSHNQVGQPITQPIPVSGRVLLISMINKYYSSVFSFTDSILIKTNMLNSPFLISWYQYNQMYPNCKWTFTKSLYSLYIIIVTGYNLVHCTWEVIKITYVKNISYSILLN